MRFAFQGLKKLYLEVGFTLKKNIHSIIPKLLIPKMSIEECLWKNVNKWQNKTAMICAETNRSYTYLELYNKANSLAHFLYDFPKLKQSDTITVVLPNLPENGIIILGAIEAGFKTSLINPSLTPGEISKLLTQADTKMIFTTSGSYENVFQAAQLSKLNVPIVLVKTKEDQLPYGTISFYDTVKSSYKFRLNLKKSDEDTILILFSSGTSGLPKAVEIQSKSVIANLHQLSATGFNVLVKTDDIYQEVLPVLIPMFHVYGVIVLLFLGLNYGCKLVTIPKFKPNELLRVMEQHKSTVLYAAPPIFSFLLNNELFKRSHFSSLKTIISGGAPLKATDVVKFMEKTNGSIDVLQGYGLTETTSVTHLQSTLFKNGVKPGGVGFLLPAMEGKIMSSNGEELGANETGELLVRGPQITNRYYKNEQATIDAYTKDGWFKTGDLGHYDEDNHFFITDRIKDLIKVKGFQVAPAELEEVIRHHPDVADVAVIGVPHDSLGEAPKAFVVRKHKSNITVREIQDYVKNKVVNYKRLEGGVLFVDSIPKSAAGKILKRDLKLL